MDWKFIQQLDLFSLGICISYDRILSNTKSIYEILCNSYARHRLFLTRNMEKKCFVILMKFYYFVIIQARTLLQTLFILMTTWLVYFWYSFKSAIVKMNILIVLPTLIQYFMVRKLSPLPSEYTNVEKVHCSSNCSSLLRFAHIITLI